MNHVSTTPPKRKTESIPELASSTSPILESDLFIKFEPRFCTRFYGSAAQLVAEGLIPDGFVWPTGSTRVEYAMGEFTFYMGRLRPPGMKGPHSKWAGGDYWFLQRFFVKGEGYQASLIYEKTREIQEIIQRGSAEWNRVWNLAWQAKKDASYMEFRQKLIGDLPRRRGRPAKSTAKIHKTTPSK